MSETQSSWGWLQNHATLNRLNILNSHPADQVADVFSSVIPETVHGFKDLEAWLESPIPLLLAEDSGRLCLMHKDNALGEPLVVDFEIGAMGFRSQQNVRNELLVKAVLGRKKQELPSVLDVTAGLGRDSFILATLGCEVAMYERNLAVYLLLKDGLARAHLHSSALARLSLQSADAIEVMPVSPTVDVVYMDPMFPARDKSALVKKEMRIFKTLVGADEDAADLFEKACVAAKRKVVVKRPRKAPFVAEAKPTYSVEGRSSRFDIYQL